MLLEVLTHCLTLCIWGNELSMNINQVKKLRKSVKIKKLAIKNNKIFVCRMKKTSVHYKMVLTIIPCLFVCLFPIANIEKIFMHILVFRPFQSSSLMITSQTTSMVRRRGGFSYNSHGSILKCSWRGRRMDGQSSTGTGLKLQRPSTWMKAQYSPSASAVFQMRCVCVCTAYDANFARF